MGWLSNLSLRISWTLGMAFSQGNTSGPSWPSERRLLSSLALVLALMAAGCGRQTAIIPPDIHYGFDTCTDCGMIIAKSHYAAALAWRTTADWLSAISASYVRSRLLHTPMGSGIVVRHAQEPA